MDSDKLVEDACEEIAKMPEVKAPEILSTRADLTVDTAGVNAEARSTALVRTAGRAVYDLPDPIAELQDAVGLTRATIKRILEGCGRYDEFALNPALFLAQVASKVNKVKPWQLPRALSTPSCPRKIGTR